MSAPNAKKRKTMSKPKPALRERLQHAHGVAVNVIDTGTSDADEIAQASTTLVELLKDVNTPSHFPVALLVLLINIEADDNTAKSNFIVMIIKGLLVGGVDLRGEQDRVFRLACQRNALAVATLMVEHGADVEAMDNYAIGLAASGGHVGVCGYLLEKGADARADDDYALRMSARNGHVDVVKLLLDSGVPVGVCAIDFAAGNGFQNVVAHLLNNAPSAAPQSFTLRTATKDLPAGPIIGPLNEFSDQALLSATEGQHLALAKYIATNYPCTHLLHAGSAVYLTNHLMFPPPPNGAAESVPSPYKFARFMETFTVIAAVLAGQPYTEMVTNESDTRVSAVWPTSTEDASFLFFGLVDVN